MVATADGMSSGHVAETIVANGKPTGLQADHYEFWLYRQIRKRFESGEIYLDDSLQHRHFSDELVSMDEKADVLAHMDIPFLRQPINAQLDTADHQNVASGLAAHPAEWALHVSKRRQNDRPRHSSDRAGVGVTEFSGVPAYTPV